MFDMMVLSKACTLFTHQGILQVCNLSILTLEACILSSIEGTPEAYRMPMLHASRAGRLRPFRHVESSLLPPKLVFKGTLCSFNIDSVSSPNLTATAKKASLSFVSEVEIHWDQLETSTPGAKSPIRRGIYSP